MDFTNISSVYFSKLRGCAEMYVKCQKDTREGEITSKIIDKFKVMLKTR